MSEYEKKMLAGIERQLVHWNPALNLELCNSCLSCVSCCSRHVYEVDKGQPKVAHPINCVIFCNRCESICPNHAITLPSRVEFLKEIREIRRKSINSN